MSKPRGRPASPSGPRRASLAGVALSIAGASGALAAAFGDAAGSTWPAVLLAWAAALLMSSLIGLAGAPGRNAGASGESPARPAHRAGRRSVRLAALTILVLVGGGLSAALLIGYPQAGGGLVWGLPPGAAVLIYVVGVLPALIVPALYAWGFDRASLAPADLERLREHRGPGTGEES